MSTSIKAMTLVEVLVASTLFIGLSSIIAFLHRDMTEATVRTLAILDQQQEAVSIRQQLTADFSALQPCAPIRLDDNQLTGMISTPSPLLFEGRGKENAYVHELVWIHYSWSNGKLARAQSQLPRQVAALNEPGIWHSNVNVSASYTPEFGDISHPQRFLGFLEPLTLPTDRTVANINTFKAKPEMATYGARLVDKDMYLNPFYEWWRPNTYNTPGMAQPIERGALSKVTSTSSNVNNIQITTVTSTSWNASSFLNPASPQVAFAVVNPGGRTVNRDYMNLLGTHPDNPLASDYPSRLKPLSLRIAGFSIFAFADKSQSIIYGTNTPLTPNVWAGRRKNPSKGAIDTTADDNVASDSVGPATPIDVAASNLFGNSRPQRFEFHFILHNLDPTVLDADDIDGDGITIESLASAIETLHSPSGVVDYDGLLTALQEAGAVAQEFFHAVNTP